LTPRLRTASQPLGRHPCLLVVDLSYGFTDPDSPLGCDCRAAVEATATLLERARRGRHPRVFTTIGYEPGELGLAAPFVEKLPDLAGLQAGGRWAEIDARVAPQSDEPTLRKLFASAFFGTPLASLLAASGCDSVIVCGASTSGCVRASAVDALQHGYRVAVVRGAVADRDAAAAEAALGDIAAKYGEVISLDRARSLLDAPAVRDRRALWSDRNMVLDTEAGRGLD
jgi:maleamate amidohydrolase